MTDLEDRIRAALRDPRRQLPAWPDPVQRIRHSARRRRAKAAAAAAAVALAVAGVASLTWVLRGSAPQPGSEQVRPSYAISRHTQTYHDSSGWSIKVPPGWRALPFTDSKNGITSTGVQLANVKLPQPSLIPGYPIQVNNRALPPRGVGLIIASDPDLRLSHGRVSKPPLPAPNGQYWTIGSALAGSPYIETLWFRVNGKTFIASAKIGPHATKSDLNALAAIIRSLH